MPSTRKIGGPAERKYFIPVRPVWNVHIFTVGVILVSQDAGPGIRDRMLCYLGLPE